MDLGGIVVSTLRGKLRLTFPRHILPKPHHEKMRGAGRISHVARQGKVGWGFDLPASPRVYRGLKRYFEQGIGVPIEFDETALRIFEYDAAVGNDTVDFKRNFLSGLLTPPPIPLTKEEPAPWDHQVRAFWFAVDRLGGLHEHARGGVLLGLDMGCVDSETEFLSPGGWVSIADWNGEKVAQVNHEGIASFVAPEQFIDLPAEKMVRISHDYGLDMVVSMDHRLALKRRSGPDSWIEFKQTAEKAIDDLSGRPDTADKHVRCSYRLNTLGRSGTGLSPYDLRLMVAVMADGYFRNVRDAKCVIRIKKTRKIERLRAILSDVGIRFSDKPCKPDGFRAFEFLAPLKIKRYPSFWYQVMTESEIHIVAEESLHWDGSESRRQFFSKHQSDADFIQWVYNAAGLVTSIKHDGRDEKGCWVVTYRKKNNRCFTLKHIQDFTPNNGRQYCFTVPTGLFVARRNGCIFVTGNCGKSRVAIDLIQNYQWQRVLIICPQKVIAVWPRQWNLWGMMNARILPLLGPTTKRAETLDKACGFRTSPLIAITNYEALDRKVMQEALKRHEWDAVILDEGHRIKDPGGKRSKWLGAFGDQVPCRLELTGTKEPNDLLDIFAQARFLDRTYYGTRFAQFRGDYAILGPAPNGQIVRILGYKNEEDLAQRNFQFCLEVDADEVQDLPEEHHVDVPVVLGPKTRAQYDQFEQLLVLQLENDEITAANILVKVGKLQEITGGFIRNPDTQFVHSLGTEKLDVLKELLVDLPPADPIVVFYRLRPDAVNIARVCDDLGRPHFECSGRINQLKDWQEATGAEVLICQISAGKEGVDLTRSRWSIYYSLGYGPGEFRQSKKRQHRPGQQAARVTFFHLVATDTVDEKIYDAITKKQKVIDSVRRLARQGGSV